MHDLDTTKKKKADSLFFRESLNVVCNGQEEGGSEGMNDLVETAYCARRTAI